jgi:carbonic anhydrase
MTTPSPLAHLLEANRAWAERMKAADPGYFSRLVGLQTPQYLWIGCSDSRVPANQITGLEPGEVFVHRNVANLVVHTDLNCLSALQFAVDVLRVRHVIVCGHYGCGGVLAAARGDRHGLCDNWLRHVQDVRDKHADRLEAERDAQARENRLCELNVIEQLVNVCHTTIVRDAWQRQQPLSVHGWIYGLDNGELRELGLAASNPSELERAYARALARLG